MKKRILTILSMSLLIANGIFAQAGYKLSDLDFIIGAHYGVMDGGIMEEHWSPPVGNSMLGTFKMHKDGKDVFYEFLVIEETESGIVMRLRHFSNGLIAWEEKDFAYEFHIIELRKNYVRFEEKSGEIRIAFYLENGNYVGTHEVIKNGTWEVEAYPFDKKRKKLAK